jgi:hypothetical protein
VLLDSSEPRSNKLAAKLDGQGVADLVLVGRLVDKVLIYSQKKKRHF